MYRHVFPCCACIDPAVVDGKACSFRAEYVLQIVLNAYACTKFDVSMYGYRLQAEGSRLAGVLESALEALRPLRGPVRLDEETKREDAKGVLKAGLRRIKNETAHVGPPMTEGGETTVPYEKTIAGCILYTAHFLCAYVKKFPAENSIVALKTAAMIDLTIRFLEEDNVGSWVRHVLALGNRRPVPCCACTGGDLSRNAEKVRSMMLDFVVHDVISRQVLLVRSAYDVDVTIQPLRFDRNERKAFESILVMMLDFDERYGAEEPNASLDGVESSRDVVPFLESNLERIVSEARLRGRCGGKNTQPNAAIVLECLLFLCRTTRKCIEKFGSEIRPRASEFSERFFDVLTEVLERNGITSWMKRTTDPFGEGGTVLYENGVLTTRMCTHRPHLSTRGRVEGFLSKKNLTFRVMEAGERELV